MLTLNRQDRGTGGSLAKPFYSRGAGRGDVRRKNHIWQLENRVVGRDGLRVEDIECRAAQFAALQRGDQRIAVREITPPNIDEIAPDFIFANLSALNNCRVCRWTGNGAKRCRFAPAEYPAKQLARRLIWQSLPKEEPDQKPRPGI